MKKEDFTTRLLRNLFHIQGPFDECRQEIIYKACARSMVQIVYSSFFLFLFYLLFGRFIEVVRYAMPYVYSGLIFFITLKTQRAVKELHLEKMTSQNSSSKPTVKLKSNFEVGLCLSVFRLASLPYSSFIKSSFSRCPFQILESCSCNLIKVFLS